MYRLTIIGLLALLAVAPAPAFAQDAKAACAQVDAALPPDLAAWATKGEASSAVGPAGLAKAALIPGQAVTASLHPTRDVAYVTQPEKPGGSAAHGGLFSLRIAEAGTYRVVLSSGAWIDLLSKGKAVESSAHAPGPACTTARKTVAFPLQPGAYVLQVSANADPTIAILVQRQP